MSDDLFKWEHCDGFIQGAPDIEGSRYLKNAISLDKANRIHREFLAKGTVVYSMSGGIDLSDWVFVNGTRYNACSDLAKKLCHTQAILVCVKPIEPEDSAERVLEDLILAYGKRNEPMGLSELVERARKLIGGKE